MPKPSAAREPQATPSVTTLAVEAPKPAADAARFEQAVRLDCLRLAVSFGLSRHDGLTEAADDLFSYVMTGKRVRAQ